MKVLVAVIAYNEEKNIEDALMDLLNNNKDNLYDIVVIDNSSEDNTLLNCKRLKVKTVPHCVNSGSSFGTLMTYFLYAYKNNYDILCQFDGDGQHIASFLPRIIEPISEGKADYVIGSRFLEKEGFQSYFFRKIGIRLFAFMVSRIIGHRITDITSGFRAYNKKVINFFAKHYKCEIFDTTQLLLLSHFAGAKVMEVPVKMRERRYGKSEYNLSKAVLFPLKGFVNILGCLLQKKKI
jgi:glycosyltransferase involved in cell wall biosynthesis